MKINNNVYDILKWFAQIVLPAMGTLYFALAGIWGFPYGEQVVGTIVAVDTFLGALLGISTAGYSGDGVLTVDHGKPKLDLNGSIEELSMKKNLLFKVDRK